MRLAITGAGVLSPLGDTLDAVTAALSEGRRAFNEAGEARIADFDAGRYAAVRGMRVYNRTTQLGICAAKLALDRAGVTAESSGDELGMVMASTFGHLDTLLEYDRSLLQNGFARTNPALMPLTLPSAPGAATALAVNAKAFSITLSDGSASSLDAVGLAGRLLASGRARACLVVSAFSPCAELATSAERAGMLAPRNELRVFDRRAQGTALGEAAVAVVIERLVDARARGAELIGVVRGQASAFAPNAAQPAVALRRACAAALRAAGVDEIDLVSSGANGVDDQAEAHALLEVLGAASSRTAITAIKASLGDAIDASGLLQMLVALAALRAGTAPPIAVVDGEMHEPAVGGLRYLTDPEAIEGGSALVTARSQSGACAALVVSRTADG